MGKATSGVAVAAALALVAFGLIGRAAAPATEPPHVISMAASGQAMLQAGAAMQAHGQAMLDDGWRTGDRELVGHGEHWLRDGRELAQRGSWMAMDPTAPGSLARAPAELVASGDWARLKRYSEAMQHVPSRERGVDLEALRANGQGMQDEGRNMAEHGRVMAEEAEAMAVRHGPGDPAVDDLRQAARTMREAGDHLAANGREMVAYADRVRRSMGLR